MNNKMLLRPDRNFVLTSRERYGWWIVAFGAAVPWMYWLFPKGLAGEGPLPLLSAFGAAIAFLYIQHLQETQFFRELFTHFNERFDKLNNSLNAIASKAPGAELNENERDTLRDYFNLCAEEYVFFKAGYVDRSVWLTWCSGMARMAKNEALRALWREELDSELYYGFKLSVFEASP